MKKLWKILGILLGVVVVAAFVGFAVASAKTSNRLGQRFEAHAVSIPLPYPLDEAELAALRAEKAPTAESPRAGTDAGVALPSDSDPLAGVDLEALARKRAIARGKHLVEARYSCNACHGENFAGGVMIDDGVIGHIRGPNLTSGKGGVVADYKMSDWDRIVRHGIKPDGSPAVMPSEDFFRMSDRELSDIVAFITSRPPVDAEVAPATFGPMGKVLVAVGKFPISAEVLSDHMAAHAKRPPETADSKEFGQHLAAVCSGCHRANFAGGPMPFGPPDWPPAANLTQHEGGLRNWTFEDFEKAMTQGIGKNGPLREPMTVMLAAAKAMTNTERRALWTFLTSLEPLATNP
jgi:cytochrome c5